MATYFRPVTASTDRPKAVTAPVVGSGLVLPMFSKHVTFQFNGSIFSSIVYPAGFSDPGSIGCRAAATDDNGVVWFLTEDGYLLNVGPSGHAVLNQKLVGGPFVGLVLIAGYLYAVPALGGIQKISGSSATSLGSGFAAAARSAVTGGANIFSILASNAAVGQYSPTSGAYTTLPTAPMGGLTALAAAPGRPLAAVGNGRFALQFGFSSVQPSPITPTSLAIGSSPSTNQVVLLTGNDPAWVAGSAVTLTGANFASWVPTGQQALATNGSALSVYTVSGGVLTLSQTLSFAGASQVAVTPDSASALVVQPAQNAVGVVSNTLGTWSAGTSVGVSNPNCVLMLSSTSAVIGTATGVTFLTRTGSAWAVTAQTNLGYAVKSLFSAGATNFYACGTSGGTGYLNFLSGTASISGTSWSGSADSVTVLGKYTAVLDKTSNLIRTFSNISSVLTQQASQTPDVALNYITVTNITLWLCGSALSYLYSPGAPYTFRNIRHGSVAIYSNSNWYPYDLGVGHEACAATYDSSGNLWVATRENELYEFGPFNGSSIPFISKSSIGVFDGQSNGTTLSIASLEWAGANLYASTTASGVLVRII